MSTTFGTVLVTGGAGFIGVHLVGQLLARGAADDDGAGAARVVVLDKLTYAANPAALDELATRHPGRLRVAVGDVADAALVRELLTDERPAAVVHLAAETHVDRSIDSAAPFIHSNVVATSVLLDELRRHLGARAAAAGFRLVHASTDEVFGSLAEPGLFTEASPYAPRSPYAASKAASDHLVAAWHHTHRLPSIITHGGNTYGPYQYPEKLIPRLVTRALRGETMPVYASGTNVRDWIHVDDHARALRFVLAAGRPGGRYLVGARTPLRNLDVVHALCDELDRARPGRGPDGGSHHGLIEHVADRPGHDLRYALDPGLLERELGWRPRVDFAAGLVATVRWYVDRADRGDRT
ncbi:MAG: dTDP-glucose 4,6-dehydratase [Kofleriaceae bacterium]|nr:dTDP-glucose 4,6-dehydratase [Kofleriaceae bacterium]MBP6840493.1 dTDP-glucose 4,6-dehydratase [Kofleriaceae bacterium]